VLNIIVDHNNDLYQYFLHWFAYFLQNPGEKCETALIIVGEQGTGKNVFFTDVLSNLVGKYAIPNESKLENIIGRFNSFIENKVLIVCNELQAIDSSKYLNTDALKSLITEKKYHIEQKFMPLREADNVTNFIFVSNHMPIKLENGDRRYVVTQCSAEKKNNFKYFHDLAESFKFIDEDGYTFYDHLYSFFLGIDMSDFNLRVIPMTILKQDIIDACKESWLLFFEDNLDQFHKGYISKQCYQDYRQY
jgi:hypothetical protein